MTRADTNVSVAFKGAVGTFALDVAFDAPTRGVTALFGPSGCGKTTILRAIAGLQKLPGRLTIGDEVWQDTEAGVFVPTHRRHLGYVFQEASLFPHISVRDNLLYGARRAGGSTSPNGLDLGSIVDLLGIGHLLDRSPANLSGGERQRIAVGRALLAGPRVLLMDEPLSALDRLTKEEILPYFEMLHETLALPIIYVSHDFSEIERLADCLVLLDKGRVMASGALPTLQTDPTLPLITDPGATATIQGRIQSIDEKFSLTRIAVDGGELILPGRHGIVGDNRRVRIAASDVSLARSAPRDTTILNCLPARIQSIDPGIDEAQVTVILALGDNGSGSRIVARITRMSQTSLALQPGQQVFAQLKGVALVASRARRQS